MKVLKTISQCSSRRRISLPLVVPLEELSITYLKLEKLGGENAVLAFFLFLKYN